LNNKIDIYYTSLITGDDERNNHSRISKDIDILYFEPEPAFKTFIDERNKTSNILKCPAFQDYYKNCFIIRSPLDLIITIKKSKDGFKYVATDRYDQEFFDAFIKDRIRDEGNNNNFPMISLLYAYLFYSSESVILEQMSPSMHKNEFLNNTRLICGKFNIGKWIRPLDYAFEIIDDTKPLVIKRGDPLYYIRFLTDKDVNFVKVLHSDDLYKNLMQAVQSSTRVKQYVPGNTLEKNYQIAENYIKTINQRFFKKKSKCPFNFLNKDKDE